MLQINKINKKLVFALTVFLVILSLIVYTASVLNSDTFYKGISLDGIDISDLSMQKAKYFLENNAENKFDNQKFIIHYGENSWTLDVKDISLKYNIDATLNNAYIIGRSGSILKRLNQIYSLRFEEINVKPVISYKTEKIKNLIKDIKNKIDKEEKNAAISYSNGKISFEREVIGKNVPIDKNVELLEKRVIENEFGDFDLYVEDKVPKICYKDIKEIDGALANFSTSFNPQDENRSHNIKLGCERLSNSILMPNDIFSMNQVLGPRTLKNGYKEAPVIFKNELVPGTGGGVCQITSTLYNAVLLSKNDVLQRTHHSWPLGYVAPGRDATIAEDYIDFKFQNTTGYPIALISDIIGNKLYIKILGKTEGRNFIVKLKNEILEEYQPGVEEVIYDDSIPDNEKVIVREARKGMKVVLYRETYNKSGELLEKEIISEDVYKPVRAQVKVNRNYYRNSFN